MIFKNTFAARTSSIRPVFKIVGNHPHHQNRPEVVNFLMHYGDLYLGKTTVLCKDTPALSAIA